jgi:hypothetical protein
VLCAAGCSSAFWPVALSSAIRLVWQPKNRMTDAVTILNMENLMSFSVKFTTLTTLAKSDSN